MTNIFFDELAFKEDTLKTYVGIVLDSSGSMIVGMKEVLSGVREQIQTLQDGTDKNMETVLIFTTFNNQVKVGKAINVKDFDFDTLNNYNPRGGTAMLDAVGDTIATLKKMPMADDKKTSFLLLIASDGEENSSTRHSFNDIAETIQACKDTGRWTITYMGANQDLSAITEQLKIDAGNVTMFSASNAEGYARGMTAANTATKGYMSMRSAGVVSLDNFYIPPK